MNRTTVLILALVLFLAHVLALHHDQAGAFALPSDLAHVNFQVGRNLVHGQGSVWWPGGTPAAILEEGATSVLWVLLAAWAELWTWSPVRTSAFVGIVAALVAVACTARLSRGRLVGVTATVLLVVSGPFAATASDGTETTLFTMLLALSFLALERRRSAWLGGSLAGLVLTGSLGLVMVPGFLLAAVALRRCEGRRLSLARAFLPPAVAGAVLVGGRLAHGIPALTPDLALLLAPDPARWTLGLYGLEALVRGTIAPLLLVLPLLQLLTRRLSGTGLRALGLGVLWLTLVVATGAGGRPMHAAFVPALPLLYLAVQEAVVGGLDRRPRLEGLTWAGLTLACLGSVLGSKFPGDLGPVPTGPALWAMAENRPPVVEAFGAEHTGRLQLAAELHAGERRRALGIFLRDQVAADARILSPWPGAIGYLARRHVVDLLGRVETPAASWRGRVRTDVVAALEQRVEYVVPLIADRLRAPGRDELVTTLLERYDVEGATPERRGLLETALAPYELVAVPVPEREQELGLPSAAPGYLLRLRDLGLAPRLGLVRDGAGGVGVQVEHAGHHQIVELELTMTGPDGVRRWVRPDGSLADEPVLARTETLLFPTGTRSVELMGLRPTGPTGDEAGAGPRRLRARLLTPFSDPADPLAPACEAVELVLP